MLRAKRGPGGRCALSLLIGIMAVSTAPGADTGNRVADSINQVLGITESEVIELSVPTTGDGRVQADFSLDGRRVTMSLSRHSVRGPNFQVLVEGPDGKLTEIDPGPVRTLRGSLLEIPGSLVTGSLVSNGLDARIQLPTGESYALTAVRRHIPDAAANLYALYDLAALAYEDGICGAIDEGLEGPALVQRGPGECEPTGPFFANLGCDGDSAFVSSFPGTPAEERAAAQQFIEDNVNEINAQVYEVPPFSTTHQIVRIVLRNAGNDIYASIPGGSAVLGALRTEWRTTQADADAHIATLWTGRNLDGNVVGRGYVGGVCGPTACWVEKRFGNQRLNLLAHELGHNWGTWHCDQDNFPGDMCTTCSGTCPVMRSTLSSCSGAAFSQCSLDEIFARRPNYTCIEDAGFVDPTILDEGVVLRDGDTVKFPEVLTGETGTLMLLIRNNQNCTLPINVRVTAGGGRFRVLDAPTSLPPSGAAGLRLEFGPVTFAGDYAGGIQITTPGLISGFEFDLVLQARAGVGNNLPTRPQLTCPLPAATIPQPGEFTFQWSNADFVETYEFQILSSTDQVLFRQPDLQQTAFRPLGLVLPAPDYYLWVVWANNVNGRVRAASGFFVDPPNAHPIQESFYSNIRFPNNHTLNLPLNPSEFTFVFEFHNEGTLGLEFDNIVYPDDFEPKWTGGFDIGGIGGEGRPISVKPCGKVTLELKSTLTLLELMQTNIIMDTLEFDSSDPNIGRFRLNLCFRCDPLACVGDPFSGCGTVTRVTQGGCWWFLADCGTEFGIRNNGNFNIGDRIWVAGAVDIDAEFCFPHNPPQIPDAQVGTCFEDCGELLEALPCLVGPCYLRFRSASTGVVYDIENTGLFPVGSQVRVVGGLQSYTGAAFSGTPQGLIFGNTIERCGRSSVTEFRR